VVGQVTETTRVDHVPVNDPNSDEILTGFSVAVEQYPKSGGARDQPPSLKVVNFGGAIGANTFVDEGDPILSVGERYLVFLETNNTPEFREDGGVMACIHMPLCGYSSYLDEFRVADSLEGKILLKNGLTSAPEDPNQSQSVAWKFRDGTTLLGITEADAIAAVKRALAAAAQAG
jgi:hypothetical protein